MDTQDTGPVELNTNSAADLIASMLDPTEVPKEPQAQEPVNEEKPNEEPANPDAAPDDKPEGTEADDPIVTIKIDGKDVEVKLSELKNGYQRQADYTRKTMEVAEQRKAAQAENEKAQQERQTYAANLQRMQVQLEVALQEQQQTDWQKLIEENPQEYLRQMHIAQARQSALHENYAAQQKLQSQVQAEQEQHRQAYLKE